MSRYEFRGPTGEAIVVGWDNPLRTFFFQGGKEDDVTGEYEFAIGMMPSEIPDVDALGEVVEYFQIGIPAGIAVKLVNDFGERTEPTENQKKWVDIVRQAVEEDVQE